MFFSGFERSSLLIYDKKFNACSLQAGSLPSKSRDSVQNPHSFALIVSSIVNFLFQYDCTWNIKKVTSRTSNGVV